MIHQKDSQEEIIIFTRYPVPGTTKTRLIPALGADGAARIQKIMSEQVVQTARQLKEEAKLCLSVYFTGGSRRQMRDWLGSDLVYHDQKGSDLGERMMHALQDAIQRGSKRIILLGADCPDIDSHLIAHTLNKLKTRQLVLGPSTDGGFYLIGISSRLPRATLPILLKNISWGTHNVFQTTVDRARQNDVMVSILKELHDIDLPCDLAYFNHHSNS